jgi:hypothetical protein
VLFRSTVGYSCCFHEDRSELTPRIGEEQCRHCDDEMQEGCLLTVLAYFGEIEV